mmetsp:Transcript_2051/g.3754  ORF Transcript_2051/g.3754 Transcript_2051/m.3754 type:complete len:113 (+) Transcript_2051:2-340(+)
MNSIRKLHCKLVFFDRVGIDKCVVSWLLLAVEKTMAKIDTLGQDKAFKFAATCMIVQRTGHGLHSANSCFWDKRNDESIVVQFPKKVKAPGDLLAIVTIYAVSLYVADDDEL